MADNSPKHTQETWNAIKLEYQAGTYKTLRELASRYNVHPNTLRTHIYTEKWSEEQSALQNKVQQKVEEKVLSKAEAYLSKTVSRMEKYEKIIDASLENLGARASDGTPLVDPEAIDVYTRSEARINAISMSALRIPVVSSVDVTSKGQSIGESLVKAIADLRESKKAVLQPEDASRLIDVEIAPKTV